jgi:hypothetical protein
MDANAERKIKALTTSAVDILKDVLVIIFVDN